MSERRPIVLVNGVLSELPTSDTIPFATVSPTPVVKYTILEDALLFLTLLHEIVEVTVSATIMVPTAVGKRGVKYNIIKSHNAGPILIMPEIPGETISGASDLSLINQWDSVVIYSNGTNWLRGS